jgi:hypothetical protein
LDVRVQAENAHAGRTLEATLQSLADQAAAVNEEEALFGWDATQWPQVRWMAERVSQCHHVAVPSWCFACLAN